MNAQSGLKASMEAHKLNTVIVSFNDFTQGIEQVEARSAEAAMAMFLREAVCLQGIAPHSRQAIREQDIKLLRIVSLSGVWLWLYTQSQVPKLPSVLGSKVIQTDRSAQRLKVG
jgi:hypothetical protein